MQASKLRVASRYLSSLPKKEVLMLCIYEVCVYCTVFVFWFDSMTKSSHQCPYEYLGLFLLFVREALQDFEGECSYS